MAYAEASAKTDSQSLSDDGQRLNSRLREISSRIQKIADTLHGSAPRPADNEKAGAPIATSLRRNLDVGHDVALEIEHELTRIEQRL